MSLVVSALLLAACDGARNTTAPSDASSAAPAVAARSAPIQAPIKGLVAEPGTVRTCEVKQGIRGLLRWDVSDSDAQKVVLYVINPRTKQEKRMGHGRPVGSKRTGPWLRPGMIFTLRDETSGQDLASVTIGGIPCH